MMKAFVVFADGSKKLAHNLDDTRERWLLRKCDEPAEIQQTIRRGVFLPAVNHETPIKDIDKHIESLQAQRTALVHYIGVVDQTRNYPNRGMLKKSLEGVIAAVNAEIATAHRVQNELNAETEQKRAIREQVNYANYLASLLRRNGIDYLTLKEWQGRKRERGE